MPIEWAIWALCCYLATYALYQTLCAAWWLVKRLWRAL